MDDLAAVEPDERILRIVPSPSVFAHPGKVTPQEFRDAFRRVFKRRFPGESPSVYRARNDDEHEKQVSAAFASERYSDPPKSGKNWCWLRIPAGALTAEGVGIRPDENPSTFRCIQRLHAELDFEDEAYDDLADAFMQMCTDGAVVCQKWNRKQIREALPAVVAKCPDEGLERGDGAELAGWIREAAAEITG
jgi:hypothetical protein